MNEFTPIILITILSFMVAIGIIVFILVYQKKQLQYLNEKKQLKADFDKELLGSRLEIQEQTMKSISQEVHDNIGQVLTVINLNLNMLTCEEPKGVLKEKVIVISELLRQAIQDLRDLSKSLHSDVITEQGLVKAIEREIIMLKKTGAFITQLSIEGDAYQLPEQKELILFRMFQEITNNVIKHAKASLVEVKIAFQPQYFFLRVTDDGQGFNVSGINAAKGLGLRNIINRSQLIGAFCNIDSEILKGTIVEITLPMNT